MRTTIAVDFPNPKLKDWLSKKTPRIRYIIKKKVKKDNPECIIEIFYTQQAFFRNKGESFVF